MIELDGILILTETYGITGRGIEWRPPWLRIGGCLVPGFALHFFPFVFAFPLVGALAPLKAKVPGHDNQDHDDPIVCRLQFNRPCCFLFNIYRNLIGLRELFMQREGSSERELQADDASHREAGP